MVSNKLSGKKVLNMGSPKIVKKGVDMLKKEAKKEEDRLFANSKLEEVYQRVRDLFRKEGLIGKDIFD